MPPLRGSQRGRPRRQNAPPDVLRCAQEDVKFKAGWRQNTDRVSRMTAVPRSRE